VTDAATGQKIEPSPHAADVPGFHIPVAIERLADDLLLVESWPDDDRAHARIFFRLLRFMRQAQYEALLMAVDDNYLPFNPQAPQVAASKLTLRDRQYLTDRFVDRMRMLLTQAGYEPFDVVRGPAETQNPFGWHLDVSLDLDAFDALVAYRGPVVRQTSYMRRSLPTFRRRMFTMSVYDRLFLLFKLKSPESHVEAVMAKRGCNRSAAAQVVQKSRKYLPADLAPDKIYLRVYRSVRSTDVEMVFPTTRVQPRRLDALMVGVLGLTSFFLSWLSPLSRILKERFYERQMDYLAASGAIHYFNLLAQDRLAYRFVAHDAQQQDFKEELLLYSFLVSNPPDRRDLSGLGGEIEIYLKERHGVTSTFNVEEACARLEQQGIVSRDASGRPRALPPKEAAILVDNQWDKFLDDLPELGPALE